MLLVSLRRAPELGQQTDIGLGGVMADTLAFPDLSSGRFEVGDLAVFLLLRRCLILVS
jgi:hypothetical protein